MKVADVKLKTGLDCTVGVRFNRWPSIIFLCGLTVVVVVGCPLYLYYNDLSKATLYFTLFMLFGSTLGITAGYHRLYAHTTYKTIPLYHAILLALGAATFQQSALKWSSLHRTHHRFTDTDRDPYNIKKGFFYAHMGWIMFWLRGIDYDNVPDLKKNALIMHQHNNFQFWALGFGVILPTLVGALYGRMLEALLFAVALRMLLVFHFTFFINSFAHTFGKQTYDKAISAKDNWLGAILTGGEGYHSFHHRFPNDYRNGVCWYHYDPSKWFIWLLGCAGWASDIKRAPENLIQAAKLEAAKNS